jgi:N-acetylmuramoyl-L-alanine amidase
MLVILDNGHGGLIKGRPQTAERRSKKFPNSKQLFEGEFNRGIVNGIIQELSFMNIPYFHVSPELEDITITKRVQRANDNNTSNCFLISVHANANPGRPGRGSEFLIHPNSGLGPDIADIFADEFTAAFPDERLRIGDNGERFKRRGNLGILRMTAMPAIITENFFFNNERETLEFLLTRSGRLKIIDFHVTAIVRVLTEVFGETLDFRN